MSVEVFRGAIFVLLTVALGVCVFLTYHVAKLLRLYFNTRDSRRSFRQEKRKELDDLLESHAAYREDRPAKKKVAYAALAAPALDRIDDEIEDRSWLGRNLGYFVFATTSPPLIIAFALFLFDLVLMGVSIINDITFQSSMIPAARGFGFLTLLVTFVPSTILVGLSMLPFGHRSRFKFGGNEIFLAIVSAGATWCPFILFSFSSSFETTYEFLVYGYYTYISGFACFGAMYFLCSLLGMVSASAPKDRSRFVPSGNWPKAD